MVTREAQVDAPRFSLPDRAPVLSYWLHDVLPWHPYDVLPWHPYDVLPWHP
jgi:hypothetical protein